MRLGLGILASLISLGNLVFLGISGFSVHGLVLFLVWGAVGLWLVTSWLSRRKQKKA